MVNLGTIVISIISHNSKFCHHEIVVCPRIFTVLARPLASYDGAVWHTRYLDIIYISKPFSYLVQQNLTLNH